MRAQCRSGIPHARPYEEHLTCGRCLYREVRSSFPLKHTAYTSLPADSIRGRRLVSLPRHHKVFIVHVWAWPEVVLYWTQKRYTHLGCLFWMGFCAPKASGTAEARAKGAKWEDLAKSLASRHKSSKKRKFGQGM